MMTSFEKELEIKLEKLIKLEINKNESSELVEKQLEGTNQKNENFEKSAFMFEEEKKKIEENFKVGTKSSYNDSMKEVIQKIVEKEVKKNLAYYQEKEEKEESVLQKDLILESVLARRRIKSLSNRNDDEKNLDYEKENTVKKYKKVFKTIREDSGKISEVKVKNDEFENKKRIIIDYVKKAYINLTFSPEAIHYLTESLLEKDFSSLDEALNRLNKEIYLKKEKIDSENNNSYRFKNSKGLESRIFYQFIPEIFGREKILISRIVKQYHTRLMN